MKFLGALIVTLASLTAFAHVEPGTYVGKTAEGKDCSMIAGRTYFAGELRHPLNERVELTVEGTLFLVGHPSVIDSAKGEVGFNHDLFQGVVPTKTGAQALEVVMEHSEIFEGPKSYTFMDSKWRTGESAAIKCDNLKIVKP